MKKQEKLSKGATLIFLIGVIGFAFAIGHLVVWIGDNVREVKYQRNLGE